MSIKSREDVNKYYQIINELIDEYTEKNKIRPSKLKGYLKPGSEKFTNFLKRNNLDTVDGSSRILQDVIEDRYHMEKDGVFTFESFKVFESSEFKIHSLKECLYRGIDKATIKYEKKIADYFDSNLGDIDIVDSDKHQFKVNDWNGEGVMVIIYSEEDIDIIKENICDHLLDELRNKEVELTNNLSLKLEDLIDKGTYYQKMKEKLSDNFCIKLIEELTGYKHKGKSDGYFVWFM
jgi:hypothetical protein